jgi:hypothetical protein
MKVLHTQDQSWYDETWMTMDQVSTIPSCWDGAPIGYEL